jgi:hypothetical protein
VVELIAYPNNDFAGTSSKPMKGGREMSRLFTTMVFLLTALVTAGVGFAETEKEASETTWVNEQGTEVRGNWSTSNIIEIETVEEYYWHKDNYDPSAHYRVAPWLYDPFNLSRESGASNETN